MTVQTLGGAVPQRWLAGRWFVPLVPIAIAVFCLSALAYYRIWQDGSGAASGLPQRLVVAIYEGIGFVPAFMFFLLVLAWSSIWFLTGELERPGGRLLRLLGLMLALAILVNLRPDLDVPAPHGGALGSYLALRLQSVFGYTISTLLVAPLALAALLLATDFFFYRYFEGMGSSVPAGRGARRQLVTEAGVENAVTDHFKGLAAGKAAAPPRRTLAWEDLPEVDLEGALPDAPYAEPEAPAGQSGPARVEEPPPGAESPAAADEEEHEPAEAEEAVPEPSGYRSRRQARLARETGEDGGPDTEEETDVADIALEAPGEDAAAEEEPEALAGSEDEYGEEDEEDEEDYEEEELVAGEDEDEDEYEEDEDEDEYEEGEDDADEYEYEAEVEETCAEAGGEEDGELLAAGESDGAGFEASEPEEDEPDDRERAEDLAEAESLADEPVVSIPRPEPAVKQGRLFAGALEAELLAEARELVASSGRASASYLQRRLRVDFDQAVEILRALAAEGVIDLEEGATSGRLRD